MPLPKDHPLRRAHWIWPQGYMSLVNGFAQFRKDFTLAAVPAAAPFYITADKAYKLFVNGTFVCRGPARGYQDHWPFDEVDLAPWLKPGANILAVQAYNPGISTFQYLHETSAGMICGGRWGDFLLVSDTSFLMRRSPAYRKDTARYSMQIDFQEHFDAREDDEAWISSPVAPTDWLATIYPEGGQQFISREYGKAPWYDVEERGIPLLAEKKVAPMKAAADLVTAEAPGAAKWENITWPWIGEVQDKTWGDGSGIPAVREGDGIVFTLPPAPAGSIVNVTLAMPEYTVGNACVAVTGAAGGETLDFHFAERMAGGRPALLAPARGCMAAMSNRLVLRRGETRHEFFHILGFLVFTVTGRGLTQPLRLKVSIREALYPFTLTGTFETSDPVLNDIHRMCRRTQQICSLDAYVDTPWREQAQWWGDARVQARNTFYLDGDPRLLARGIKSIGGQRTPDGLTFGHAPTSAHNCILPDFALTWIMTIYDHWWQTGDTSLVKEELAGIHTTLRYFDQPAARHPSGLLRHDRRFWYFGDWSPIFKGEIPIFLNLWYVYTLRHLVTLAKAAGLKSEAKAWNAMADRHEKLVVRHGYDPVAKLFIGGLDENLVPKKEYAVHEQTLALAMGLCPQGHETMVQTRLLPFLKGGKVEGAIPSPFWATYVFEEMALRGHGPAVVDFIRSKWTPWLVTGTTWENYEWVEVKGGTTVSHAWTAHPVSHFVNILAGLTQTAPGWSSARFSPQFMAGLTHARASVPTPLGPLVAKWKQAGNEIHTHVEVPVGMTLDLAFSSKPRKVTGPCTVDEKVAGVPVT